MKKRLLLYGFYGIGNVGNEAMLRALIEPIREHFKGEIEIVVASRHPDNGYNNEYKVTTIPNLEYATREMARGRWLRGLNQDDTPELMKLFKEVAQSDLVIFGPGQYLVETGEFGLFKGALAQFHVLLSISKLVQTPFYGLALACEPLSSPLSILTIDNALRNVDRLTFRDPQSVKNLKDAGIDLPEYEVLGDLALAAAAAAPSIASTVTAEAGIPPKAGPRLAVAFRSIYWLGIDQQEIRQRISAVICRWLDKWPEADVIMIPQNVYRVDCDRDDDRVANNVIFNQLPSHYQNRVHQVRGEYTPEQTEALYSTADITLAARLHGSVFSCKQGVPPVVLSFMDKTVGFFSRLGLPDRLLDLNASVDELFAKLLSTYDNRAELSSNILKSVASIHQQAVRYPQIAIELLEQGTTNKAKREWVERLFN